MHYMLLPYEQHCDDGLGAMGDEFEEAGRVIGEIPKQEQNFRLARCYLFRHAIELYLKSAIVILHRGLKIPYGDKPYDGIGYVKIKSEWKPIHRTHSVRYLWEYLREATHTHSEELKTRCQTDWEVVPEGLEEAIAMIDELDKTSTFFRYPNGSKAKPNIEKSAWRERKVSDLNLIAPQERPIKMLLLTDTDDKIHSAFEYHEDTLAETLAVLEKTANDLTGLHVGLRCELMGGR